MCARLPLPPTSSPPGVGRAVGRGPPQRGDVQGSRPISAAHGDGRPFGRAVEVIAGPGSVRPVVEDLCERTLTLVGGRADAVVVATVGSSGLTRFANGRIHQNVAEDVVSVRLALAAAGRLARASTTRTDDDGLAALVDRALAAVALRPPDPDAAGFAEVAAVADVDHWDDATAGATPDDRAATVAGFVAAGAGGRTDESAGFCSTCAATGRWARRPASGPHPLDARGARRHPPSGDPATAGRGGGARGGRGGLRRRIRGHAAAAGIDSLDARGLWRAVAGKARAGLDPVVLPPGRYEVVLEPRAVAAALLFPAVAGLNGKAFADGTSFVRLGEDQWDAAIDIWDDATDPRAVGDPFDAEGTPKRPLPLVLGGVSVGLTHDRRSARLAEVEPTGHSVGNEALGGYPTDLFLTPGDRSPDALVASVERGLLVTDLWYNRILDPAPRWSRASPATGCSSSSGSGGRPGAEPALHAVCRGGVRAGPGPRPGRRRSARGRGRGRHGGALGAPGRVVLHGERSWLTFAVIPRRYGSVHGNHHRSRRPDRLDDRHPRPPRPRRRRRRPRPLLVGRGRPAVHRVPRRRVGPAAARRARTVRPAVPRVLPVGAVVAHHPAQAARLLRRVRRVRPRGGRRLRRRRGGAAHGRRRHRPQPTEDRRRHRQREAAGRHARAGRDAGRPAVLVRPEPGADERPDGRFGAMAEIPSRTPASVAMSKALKARGFRFVGPVVAYALMQSAGIVDDHLEGCWVTG